MKALVSITLAAALVTGAVFTLNDAEASALHRLKQYQAYDQFWLLKNPGGPVEQAGGAVSINPQPLPPRYLSTQIGLGNPGAKVGFNPQPDPPGFE